MWKRRYGIFEFVSFNVLSNFCFDNLTVARLNEYQSSSDLDSCFRCLILKQTPPPKAVKKATPAKAAKAASAVKNGAAKKAESEDDGDDDSGEF